ncbi:hypothetical protein F2P81_024206 [Scophthalmus maximus]|uniref:Uncharacterized protein n=1 Tax=Scophthalmus maximus TaxID=52904 RepID=A0A6A4RM47_SCOMX|nr:hypothetical protein F2P81_024206 [Scophthalmus maximus]
MKLKRRSVVVRLSGGSDTEATSRGSRFGIFTSGKLENVWGRASVDAVNELTRQNADMGQMPGIFRAAPKVKHLGRRPARRGVRPSEPHPMNCQREKEYGADADSPLTQHILQKCTEDNELQQRRTARERRRGWTVPLCDCGKPNQCRPPSSSTSTPFFLFPFISCSPQR